MTTSSTRSRAHRKRRNARSEGRRRHGMRAILAALERHTGQSLAAPAVVPMSGPRSQACLALRGVPPDQLLDLAIQRLRAALPAGVRCTCAAPQVPHHPRRQGVLP